jgi:uncharacterized glyoxalase superfamily protein PhnB
MKRQKIIPYLYYEDGVAAMDYLCKTFGFEEHEKVMRDDGTFMHGELAYQDNVVMLGTPLDESGKPKKMKNVEPRTCCVLCYVDDVDAHYEKLRDAGATITASLEDKDYGDRMFGARDLEGHDWYFATPKP